MSYEKKARRILSAIEDSRIPVSYHSMNEDALIQVIAAELKKIDKDESDKNSIWKH